MANNAVPTRIEYVDVTISDGASLSSAVNLGGRLPVAVIVPTSWTSADMTFEVSADNSTFYDLYSMRTGSSVEVKVSVGAGNAAFALDHLNFTPAKHLKVRSGTTGTPVNQSGDITVKLCLANVSTG